MICVDTKKTHRRVKVPTVFQLENAECGAASLTMILKYFKRRAELSEIRSLCNVTARDGSFVSDLVRVAKGFGLDAKGYKMSAARVHYVIFPAIIHWNFNHFIVLEGYKNHTFYLRDSCSGGFTVGEDEFNKKYTGIVICFSDRDDTGSINNRHKRIGIALRCQLLRDSILRSFVANRYVKCLTPLNICYCLVSIIAFLFNAGIPILAERLMHSEVTHLRSLGYFSLFTGAYIAVLALRNVLLLHNRRHTAERIFSTGLKKLLALPSLFFISRDNAGGRIMQSSSVYQRSFNAVFEPALSLFTVLILCAELCYFTPALSLLLIPLCMADLVIQFATAARNFDMQKKVALGKNVFCQNAVRELELIETIKAMGAEQYSFQRWAKSQATLENDSNELKEKGFYTTSSALFLKSICFGSLIVSTMNDQYDTGLVLAAIIAITLCFEHNEQGAKLFTAFREAKNSVKSLEDIHAQQDDTYVTDCRDNDGSKGDSQAGDLELRSVSFGYNRFTEPQIKEFSLIVNRGEIVGLHGGSGSGKSIIAKLAARLYQPWSGEVLAGYSVALVEQRTNIFYGTIRDNVTLFNGTISDQDMENACRLACLHEEIINRPYSYNAMLKDGGINISGGQRQRIEIARALLAKPSILILDEAISALDSLTAQTIIKNIRNTGITCLLFSHNRSFITLCDRSVDI